MPVKTFLDSIGGQIKTFFTGLSRGEKIRFFVLVGVVIALSILVASLLGRTTYATLYSGLSAGEAGEILRALEDMGVPAKTQGTDTVLVPQERVSDLRMRLSADGYMSTDFDYAIFDRATGFGTTDLEKQTYYQYQLQAHLRNYILRMEKIQDCLVIVNLPRESSFVLSANTQPATASVMLEVRGGAMLTKSEANAIAQTVASGVPGLQPENIRIVDSKMNLYSIDGAGGIDTAVGVNQQFELEEQVKDRLEQQVVNFLEPVFGREKIKASVNVALNFDKELIQAVKFEPPVAGETDGIIVSMQELYESSRTGVDAGGVPGTDSNGMGTVFYPYDGLDDDEVYNKVLREMNYEINETTSQLEKAQGTIKDLSIAVLIDAEAVPEDYTSNVANLVAKAIGVGEDYITVERLPFTFTDTSFQDMLDEQNKYMADMQRNALIRTVITGLIILVLGLAVLSLIRTILRGMMEGQRQRAAAEAYAAAGGNIDYIADGDEKIQYEDFDLNTKNENVQQLEKFIDKDPQAVAQLLRNWLTDDVR